MTEYLLSERVVSALRDKSLTVITAESCTGGLVAKMLTEKKVYTEIVKETGASTATISRVKRALFDNDTYGYTLVLDKMSNEDKA